jgi:hypothetical protein
MSNTIRIKRRTSGAAGAPTSLANAELAFNEVDDVLYYGKGTGGVGGTATSILTIGGPGAFVTLTSAQTISGNKTFTGDLIAPTQLTADSSTKVATTAFVKNQNYLTGNQTITLSGDASGSGTTAIAVTLGNVGTAGTYTKVTTDAKGRVTSGTTLVATDIPTLPASRISDFDTQVRTSRLDQMAAPIAGINLNNQRIIGVAAPQLPGDAVNKEYADSIAQSLNIHGAADFATNAAVSYTYTSGGTNLTITTITGTDTITFSADHGLHVNSQIRTGDVVTGTGLVANTTYYVTAEPALNQVRVSATFGGTNATLTNGTGFSIGVTGDPGVGATLSGCPNSVDSGATLVVGRRILVKDHTIAAYNGVYTVTTVGTGANGVWTRASDFDNGPTGEITSGDYVFVASGTTNGGNGFIQTSFPPIRMGRSGAGYTTFTGDSLSFTQFSGAGQIDAGAGLTKTGNQLNVGTASSGRIVINADNIDLASGIVATGTYRSVTVDTYGRVTAGTNPTTLVGYGITDAQPLDATLTALAGITTTANQLIYATGADTFTTTSLTAFGRSLIDDADAANARITLSLGTISTQDASNVNITGGSIIGITFDGGSF